MTKAKLSEYGRWYYKEMGLRIRSARYRQPKRVSQKKMALYLGVAPSVYTCIENGYHKCPVHILELIAEKYGVELTELIPKKSESPYDNHRN